MAFNISSQGLKVVIIGSQTVTLDDFADDSDPITIQPIDTNKYKYDINGNIVPINKCEAYIVTVAVIPGSPSDIALMELSMSSRFDSSTSYEEKYISMVVTQRHVGQLIFSSGRIQTGNVGMSADSNRYKGNCYTFFFKSGEKG